MLFRSQIPQANQEHAHRMLQCLVVAVRPLYVDELAELLAFDFDGAQGGIPKYHPSLRLDDQTQAVLSTCSSLVTIINEQQWPGLPPGFVPLYSPSPSRPPSPTPYDPFSYDPSPSPHRRVVQFSHFSVKEFLVSERLMSSLCGDILRYHIRLQSDRKSVV